MMIEILAALLIGVGIGVTVACCYLALLIRRLGVSIECLCSNVAGLRDQIGHGGHGH